MKKIIFMIALMATVPVLGGAQRNIASLDTDKPAIHDASKNPTQNPVSRLRAEKEFMQSHKQADNIRLYDDPNGYFIYYTRDGNRGRCFYNKKGKFVYDAISYPEQFLNRHLRDRVKSVYYSDYMITQINEIHVQNEVVYFVHLTDGKTWKKLKIHNDNLDLVEEFLVN